MATPSVSVVVPNYNHAPFLRQRIDSILAQTYQDFELILLDDCSTDNSREILQEYASNPHVTHVEFNEANSGSTFKQWKRGLGLASGTYVWIAESDDYAESTLLEQLVRTLDADSSVAFAYCRSALVEADSRPSGFLDERLRHPNPRRWSGHFCVEGREECGNHLIYVNVAASASSVVFRRSVYERVGGVDDTLRTSGDWKLWAAMALTGKVAYVSYPLNYYRSHGQTVRTTIPDAVIVAEQLDVIRWISRRVTPTESALEKACADRCERWVRAIMHVGTPFQLRLRLVRSALRTDPHAMRRATRPAITAVRLKIRKTWRDLRTWARAAYAKS